MKSFLLAEKLIIENKTYTVNSLHTLPNSLKMSNIGVKKITDKITAFYGSLCWLSNFKYASFTYGDIFYHSSEQFLHHHNVMTGFPLFSKYQIPGFLKVFGPKFQVFSRIFVPNSRYFHTNFSYKNLEMY